VVSDPIRARLDRVDWDDDQAARAMENALRAVLDLCDEGLHWLHDEDNIADIRRVIAEALGVTDG
jgi:hypothetical protein